MKWFGRSWNAPVNYECAQVETPEGCTCSFCDEDIRSGDRGVIYDNGPAAHLECFMRSVIGSAAHVMRQCSCFIEGASETDPPELSKREAARLALELWEEQNQP